MAKNLLGIYRELNATDKRWILYLVNLEEYKKWRFESNKEHPTIEQIGFLSVDHVIEAIKTYVNEAPKPNNYFWLHDLIKQLEAHKNG